MTVIKTAFIPPGLGKNLIKRKKLLSLLQENKDKKLVLLKAGSGWGKSLLASDYYHQLEEKKIWIRVPENFFSLITLIRYIIYALNEKNIIKSTDLLNRISSLSLEELVIEVINVLSDKVEDELYIFIDDFHKILFSGDVTEDLLKLFVNFTPANVHFIIISHQDLPFPVSKLRLASDFFQLDQKDFVLDFEDVNNLLAKNRIELSLGETNHIYKLTEGWIAILGTVIYSIKTNKEKGLKEVLVRAKLNISEYIKEIIKDLPGDLKMFLQKTGVFERIEVDICNKYLKQNDSLQILKILKELNLVQQYDEKTFGYHQLLKENLTKYISSQEYIMVADLYLDLNRKKEAITYLIKGGEIQRALEIILAEIEGQLKDYVVIQKWLKQLPEKHFIDNPRLYFYRGSIQEKMARYDLALKDYKKAEEYFVNSGKSEVTELNKTRIQIIGIYWYQKKFKKTVKNCRSLLTEIEEDDHNNLADLYNLLGMSLINLSAVKEGKSYLQKAIEHCHKSGNTNKKAWLLNNLAHLIYLPSGDLSMTKKNYNQALTIFNEEGDISGQSIVYANLSDFYYQIGAVDLAQKMIDEVKAIYKNTKNEGLIPVFLILQARIDIEKGQIDEACKNLEQAEQYSKDRKFLEANLYLTKSYFYLVKEQLTESNIWVEKALAIARSIFNKYQIVEYELQKLKIEYLLGSFSQASSLCNNIIEKCEEGNNLLFLTEAYLYKMAIDNARGKLEERDMERLVNLIEDKDYYFLFDKLDFITEVIAGDLFDKFNDKDRIEELINNYKKTGHSQKHKLKKSMSTTNYLLRIHIFGEFRLIKGNKCLTTADFKNKKALNILKYLIIHSGREIHQEKLLDIFWPEFSLKKARQNLYVALYEIRKKLALLDGNQEYIISKNSLYQFNTEKPYWIDIEEFQSFYQEGNRYYKANNHIKAKEYYLKAQKIYNNGFLLENIYDDWIRDFRDYYQEKYLAILKNLFEIENNDNPDKALAYGEDILSINPYLEDVNIKVIKILIQTGNLNKAFKHYRDLKELYNKELEIEFPQKITRLLENVD